MKRSLMIIIGLLLVLSGFIPISSTLAKGPKDSKPDREHGHPFSAGKVVVANRVSGTISIIDTRTDQVADTIALPATGIAPDPMYVVYTHVGHRVFVGDRNNNRVVVFDADDFSVEGIIPTGNGIFHMWADPQNRQLWVNNDIDNTVTVIDPATLQVLTTVPMPTDLVADGGKTTRRNTRHPICLYHHGGIRRWETTMW